jgi:GNAT superfamily N-acetyltransferase
MIKTGLAATSDIDALIGLVGLLFEQEAEFSPDPELQRQGLARIIQNPQLGEIIVLREGDSVIGMASLLYTISTALGGRAALLEDMIVDPHYRGRGYGTQLITNAIQRAKNAGCLRIRLLTDADNTNAQRFYLRNGFQPSGMKTFTRLLTGNTDE